MESVDVLTNQRAAHRQNNIQAFQNAWCFFVYVPVYESIRWVIFAAIAQLRGVLGSVAYSTVHSQQRFLQQKHSCRHWEQHTLNT